MPEMGRQLDLTSSASPRQAGSQAGGANRFLGVHFACCDVYARVYANQDRSAYVGHCPRCAKRVQFQVGAEGTDARFFKAY